MTEQILNNPAALNALKRHQLVSLSKRYGLKASGKNGDMVERLQSYAASLPSGQDIELPPFDSQATPHHANADFIPADPDSPTPLSPAAWMQADRDTPLFSLSATSRLDKKASMISVSSENWDKMSESGASFISPMKAVDQGSVRSWKSAGNGQPLSNFAPSDAPEKFKSSSSRKNVLSIASSLRRTGTRTFLGPRSTSQSSNLTVSAADELEPEEAMESMPVPPSPASTVGVPRRHSRLSLFERPSTLRLCSPTPGPDTPGKKGSDLPFVGSASKLQELKNRRSMAPLRSPTGADTDHFGLSRKSMPALTNYTSASLGSIYPPLPGFQPDLDAPPVPPMPGHFPTYQPLKHQASAETFVFGSPDHAVSSAKFTDFSNALLKEINDKLPEDARMGGEVLKGKQADMKRMVSVTSGLGGEGGWGLMETFEGKRDRFAAVHEREFSKMSSIAQKPTTSSSSIFRSKSTAKSLHPTTPGQKRKHSAGSASDIPSAPNGGSMDGERQAKKSRMSPGPNVLGSLRDAGRSVMTLLGDGEGKTPARRAAEKRQRSRLSIKGNGLRSRLSMFRTNFRKPAAAGETTAQERSAQLQKSLRRRSAEFSTIIKRTPDLPINPPMSLNSNHPRSRKERMPSTSAQTMMSTASSKIPQRKPLPDFGGRVTSSSSKLTSSVSSTNALGLPKPKSSSLSSSRKQSQADLIRNARRAPAPPIVELSEAPPHGSSHTEARATADPSRPSSTLYASTASSRARMHATVKPATKPTARPLPMAPPPVPSTTMPPSSFRPYGIVTSSDRFGAGESRENLFEENFHLPPPPSPHSPTIKPSALLPSRTANGGTPGRPAASSAATSSPLKPASAASRIRHKNSTLSAIKSRGNLKDEVDVQRRKAEMRAKVDRRNEERELREMLGGLRDDGAA